MRYIKAFAVSILLTACSGDVVTNYYPTLADAQRDEFFGRGWLPDVLPPSTRNIRAINNLDLNESDGEFSFRPSETSELLSKLEAGAPPDAASAERSDLVALYIRRGYSVWFYEGNDAHWLFFCKLTRGHCEYTMWSTRHTPNNSFKPTPLRGAA